MPTDALESGKRRILIVDDDQAVVNLISEVLSGDGRFEIRAVNNGFGAGVLAKEYHPNLIILDVMLPDISGRTVCELIRRNPTMVNVKIVCISGMLAQHEIQELHNSGADDLLQKPLDIDELLRRVRQRLGMEAPPHHGGPSDHRLGSSYEAISGSGRFLTSRAIRQAWDDRMPEGQTEDSQERELLATAMANISFPDIATEERSVMHRHRAELIRKKNQQGLTDDEWAEFERLQILCFSTLDGSFPPAVIDEDSLERPRESS